jgi:hypothetical protein
VSENATSVTFDLQLSGKASVDGRLKFTPHNHGHLLVCHTKFREAVDLDLRVKEHTRRVVADIEQRKDRLRIDLGDQKMMFHVSPSPFEAVFVENPHLTVNCAPAIAGIAIADLVERAKGKKLPVFTRDIEHDFGRIDFEVPLAPQVLQEEPQRVTLVPELSDQLIVFRES